MKKNILFICRYNRFRSRIAEKYFNKINKNKDAVAKSAGLIRGEPITSAQTIPAKKFGLDISGTPQELSYKILDWQNIIVVVADDVPKIFVKKNKETKKVFYWKIKDANLRKGRTAEIVIKELIVKVKEFEKQLNGRKNGNS
jgi:protein-tyrosine-phosphatase